MARTLLAGSVLSGNKRYAVHDGRAYCAQQSPGDLWHGYPVAWKEVPHNVVQAFRQSGAVSRSDIRRHWH